MHPLCRVDDIAEPGAKGFLPTTAGGRDLFVVRFAGRVYGYMNSCPHLGTPLEFLPDRFLTRDGTSILCSTHGARFDIATGRCVAGPCKGQFLVAVPLHVENGMVSVRDP